MLKVRHDYLSFTHPSINFAPILLNCCTFTFNLMKKLKIWFSSKSLTPNYRYLHFQWFPLSMNIHIGTISLDLVVAIQTRLLLGWIHNFIILYTYLYRPLFQCTCWQNKFQFFHYYPPLLSKALVGPSPWSNVRNDILISTFLLLSSSLNVKGVTSDQIWNARAISRLEKK